MGVVPLTKTEILGVFQSDFNLFVLSIVLEM